MARIRTIRSSTSRKSESNSAVLCTIVVVIFFIYAAITLRVFVWDASTSETPGSDDINSTAGASNGHGKNDSLDHFLESILIEGFPQGLKKKNEQKLKHRDVNGEGLTTTRKQRLRGQKA
jgi:hypothetical protein